MILYVNGDSNSAGAELANSYAFAGDDPSIPNDDRSPHPDNIPHSFGSKLAAMLNRELVIEAESASSNQRILRTTMDYVVENYKKKPFVLIGWTTWEREEWYAKDESIYQVSAGGQDALPPEMQDRYKEWIAGLTQEEIDMKTRMWETFIKQVHLGLKEYGIRHLFFNAVHPLIGTWSGKLHEDQDYYFHPYDKEYTFYNYLCNSRHEPNENYHHGKEAHREWADLLFDKIRFMV